MSASDFLHALDQIGFVCGGFLLVVTSYALYYDYFDGRDKGDK